jgi:hypothetical protein
MANEHHSLALEALLEIRRHRSLALVELLDCVEQTRQAQDAPLFDVADEEAVGSDLYDAVGDSLRDVSGLDRQAAGRVHADDDLAIGRLLELPGQALHALVARERRRWDVGVAGPARLSRDAGYGNHRRSQCQTPDGQLLPHVVSSAFVFP